MDTAVHLLKELTRSDAKATTSCGKTIKLGRAKVLPASLTAWASDVTCPRCKVPEQSDA